MAGFMIFHFMVFMNQNYSSIYSILIYMMIIGAAIDKSRLVGVKTLLIALNYKKKKINVRLDKFFFFFHCLLLTAQRID